MNINRLANACAPDVTGKRQTVILVERNRMLRINLSRFYDYWQV